MANSRIFGTLTKKEAEVLREFLQRFIAICPEDDGEIDLTDRKCIAAITKIDTLLNGLVQQGVLSFSTVR